MKSAIVIGGGHNGLTAAALLAKSGVKVTVLEAQERTGGLCARYFFGEGAEAHADTDDDEGGKAKAYTVPGFFHDTSGVREAVVDHLGLGRYGLARRKAPIRIHAPRADASVPGRGGGEPIWIEGSEIGGAVGDKDRAGHKAHRAFIDRVSPVLRALLDRAPPDPTGEVWPLLLTGLKVRRLGSADMLELLRVAPMCVADWMRDTYDTERLRAARAVPALEGAFGGVWSAGTASTLLFKEATKEPEVAGGPAALARALLRCAVAQGVTIRTSCRARRIHLKAGRARAVSFSASGQVETLEADAILSTVDPKQTFLALVGEQRLPLDLATDIRNFRARGTIAKLHLALSGPLALADGTEIEALVTGDTLDDLERAFDPLKYGTYATAPILDVRVPTVADPKLSPVDGHHVVTALVHFAPQTLEAHGDGAWTDEHRDALMEAAIAQLSRHCPAVGSQIVAKELWTPADIASRYGTTGGHIHHGEPALDQLLFMRPTVDCANYATPIPGLFLGGSGSHPGGGATCAPGALAARTILSR
jgi:phytoene dehydrogenase-like protein